MSASAAVDGDRLWTDLMVLGEITEPGQPYTRRSFSPMFQRGRDYLRARMLEAGLSVRLDTAGNLIGRLDGRQPGPAIVLGSHSDTVAGGGRFDGVAGVVAALEVVRVLASQPEPPLHPIEVIDFLAEEPSPFGLSCVGSRGIADMLTPEMLDMADGDGRRLGDALRALGGDPDRLAASIRRDIAAFLELHIEQGPVLEAAGLDVGVVTSLVGIRRIEIGFSGQAAHAGTAPMDLRRDAGAAGAAAAVKVREHAEALAAAGEGYFVATVGIFELEPGASNVVPGRCRLVIDARSSDPALTDRFVELIDRDSLAAAEAARVDRSAFTTLSDSLPTLFDEMLRGLVSEAATHLGHSQMEIASGAGHDAAFMARVCPCAMVFIPCLRGMSHTPDEWATQEQMLAGTAVLLETVRRLDARLNPETAGKAA